METWKKSIVYVYLPPPIILPLQCRILRDFQRLQLDPTTHPICPQTSPGFPLNVPTISAIFLSIVLFPLPPVISDISVFGLILHHGSRKLCLRLKERLIFSLQIITPFGFNTAATIYDFLSKITLWAHGHTHAHINTHIYTHTSTRYTENTRTHIHTYTHVPTRIHTHVHIGTYIHTYTRAHTYAHKNILAKKCT